MAVEAGGLRWRLRQWGADAEASATALLLHGVTSSSETWWRVGPALAGRFPGLRVVAPDLPGHGGSATSPRDYRFATTAGEVASLIAALGLRRPLVVGHSWGGCLGLHLAAGEASDLRACVLLDPPLRQSGEMAEQSLEMLLAPLAHQGEALAAALRAEHPDWDEGDVQGKVRAVAELRREAAEAVVRQNAPWDLRPLLRAARCPLLLLAADPMAGAVVSPADLRHAREQLGPERVVVVPEADHNLHRGRFPDTIEALAGFLSAQLGT